MTKRLSLVLGFALILLSLSALRITPWFPVDDAYISFRYARNWAEGHGPVFNTGERVEGYSNFLYVCVLTVTTFLGITPPLASRWINFVSIIAVVTMLLHALPGRPGKPYLKLAAALVMVLSSHTVANVLSGLEAPLAAALLLGAVLALEHRRRRLGAFLFLLLSLLRPEGVFLALTAAVADLIRIPWKRPFGAELRSFLLPWAAAMGIPYSLHLVWRWLYYGYWIPNSVHAKTGFSVEKQFMFGRAYLEPALRTYWPILVLPLAAGFWYWLRRRRFEGWRFLLLVSVLAVICLQIAVGDPYTPFLRYFYPALPLLLAASVMVSGAALEDLRSLSKPAYVIASSAIVGLMIAQVALAHRILPGSYASPVDLRARVESGLVDFLRQDDRPHDVDVPDLSLGLHKVAAWLVENSSEDELLATSEVGTYPYYSGVRVVDTAGLVDEHVAHLPGEPGFKSDYEYVFDLEPDYFVFKKRKSCLCSGTPADVRLFRDPRLRNHYDLVRIFPDGALSILLFKRRSRPMSDPVYDLCDSFDPSLVEVTSSETGAESWPGRFTAKGLIAYYDEEQRARALEALTPAAEGQIEDFEAAEAMRSFLLQWRCFTTHLPMNRREDMAVVYRLDVPDAAELRFASGMTDDPRNMESDDVVFEIEVEDAAGEKSTVFLAALKPRKGEKVWGEYAVDLGEFGGESVALYLRVYHKSQDATRERKIFNAGWVGMKMFQEPTRGAMTTDNESQRSLQ